jgi:hypothetical protein
MGRKSKTEQLTASLAGQHLALSVAAHLARTQLVPDPLKVYDAQHLSEMLDVVARALSKVAPIYVRDAGVADPRPLTPAELDGAIIRRGATIVALADGRSFSSATIKRLDLRQAIAILKAVGIEDLEPRSQAAEPPPDAPKTQKLLEQLREVESLLEPPLLPGHLERAGQHMIWIAREAPHGRVANLAMRLMSALHEARGADALPPGALAELAYLRAALEDVQRA